MQSWISGDNTAYVFNYYEIILNFNLISGGCSAFVSFEDSVIRAIEEGKVVESLSMSGTTGFQDKITYVTCNSATAVNAIFQTIYNLMLSDEISITISTNCEGSTWIVKRCLFGGIALCVNCIDPCALTHRENTPLSLFINPCGSTIYRPPTQMRLLTITMQNTYLPVNILAIHSSPSSYAIQLKVHTDGTAFVVCNAFPDIILNVTLQQVIYTNFREITTKNIANVTVRNLSPSTSYAIYCVTQALGSNNWLGMTEMQATRMVISTSCCIQVTIGIRRSSVMLSELPVDNFVIVSVDDSVQYGFEVQLSIFSNGENHCLLIPDTVVFLENKALRSSVNVQLRDCQSVGNFTIVGEIRGANSNKYDVNYVYGNTINIFTSNTKISPKMVKATFSSDLLSVLVVFNYPTNYYGGSKLNCAEILQFTDANHSMCGWISSTQLIIKFSYLSVLSIDDLIYLKSPGLLIGQPTDSYFPTQYVKVELPIYVSVFPIVSLIAPSSIKVNDSFVLDLSTSTGSGGRPWKSISFLVTTVPYDNIASATLRNYLNKNYRLQNGTVPGGYVSIGFSYIIQTILCNFVDMCSSGVSEIRVEENTISNFLISGSPTRKVRIDSSLSLSVLSSTFLRQNSYTYIWKFYNGTSEDAYYSYIWSSAYEPTGFFIPAYALRANCRYEVKLTVVDSQNNFAKSGVYIDVLDGNIVANIKRGAYISASVYTNVTIDASTSYDSNISPSQSDRSSHLHFSWVCVELHAKFSDSPCRGLQWSNSYSDFLTVDINFAARGKIFQFTVTVSSGGRSDQASIDIEVFDIFLPRISLTSSESDKIIKSSRMTTLFGSIGGWSDIDMPSLSYSLVWSVDDPNVNLNATSFSPTVTRLTSPLRVSNMLLINSVLLQSTSRSSLTFTLTCSFMHGEKSWASISLAINSPPSPGIIQFVKCFLNYNMS